MAKDSHSWMIAIGVFIVIAALYGGAFSTVWAPQTSFTSDWTLDSGNLNVNAAGATIRFNSLYNNGQLLLRVKSLMPSEGKSCSDYATATNNFVINSGCGDVIEASGAELVSFEDSYCAVLITLQKPFIESNLPGCYSGYRPAGWSDSINAMVEGSASFKEGGIEVITPVDSPDTPVERAAEKEVIITVVDVVTQQPIENATVQVGTQTVQTDSEGKATIEVIPGLYQVTVTNPSHGTVSAPVTIGSEAQTLATVKLEKSADYSGFFWVVIAIIILIIILLIIKI